jgi:hypothetical protein
MLAVASNLCGLGDFKYFRFPVEAGLRDCAFNANARWQTASVE